MFPLDSQCDRCRRIEVEKASRVQTSTDKHTLMDGRRDNDSKPANCWKNRTDEARAIAAEQSDPTAKAILDAIAHKYDRLAEQADRLRFQRH